MLPFCFCNHNKFCVLPAAYVRIHIEYTISRSKVLLYEYSYLYVYDINLCNHSFFYIVNTFNLQNIYLKRILFKSISPLVLFLKKKNNIHLPFQSYHNTLLCFHNLHRSLAAKDAV